MRVPTNSPTVPSDLDHCYKSWFLPNKGIISDFHYTGYMRLSTDAGSRLSRAFGSNSLKRTKAASDNFHLSTCGPCSWKGEPFYSASGAQGGRWICREAGRLVQQFEQSGTGWSGKRFARCGALLRTGWTTIGGGIEAARQRRWDSWCGGACGEFSIARFATAATILCGAQQRFQTEAL